MKIVFTGGGTGGHFYPIVAIAEAVNVIVRERKLVNVRLYLFSTTAYDERALFENNIEFIRIRSGKWRRYFSLLNFFDLLKIVWGTIKALIRLYLIYPDVVLSKGGYVSLPTVLAARVLGIPLVIHESDSRPGRANLWAGKFAVRIALSYAEAADAFGPKRQAAIAVTGNPIRSLLHYPLTQGAREFLGLAPDLPVILVTGGSQGAAVINEVVVDALPELVKRYNVIHQTGAVSRDVVEKRTRIVLEKNELAARYKLFAYLDSSALRMAAGAATLAVSRAGSMIFELAQWGIPAILVPIPETVSHDQRSNAFTYARAGGAIVIEQNNFLPSVLVSEIDRLIGNPKLLEAMRTAAKSFAKPQAARLIAEELIKLALSHER
ncbi:MAG: UDP-N-acetylglucosamine--N-acetylmuramyl-(pentapeptide) pyrophosphoryl-undecaprenol N-acetylglucosamine transferase [Candidatus Vogelbacteria bacterium]|nr:UDP-N-acetylglucosamine--N-acetylmuramyl-(pentapeptide) pyrophosphoryl-undecaprenol N-acetylglucosamine transferase [Candidatus Vogelbacteria bacterium]